MKKLVVFCAALAACASLVLGACAPTETVIRYDPSWGYTDVYEESVYEVKAVLPEPALLLNVPYLVGTGEHKVVIESYPAEGETPRFTADTPIYKVTQTHTFNGKYEQHYGDEILKSEDFSDSYEIVSYVGIPSANSFYTYYSERNMQSVHTVAGILPALKVSSYTVKTEYKDGKVTSTIDSHNEEGMYSDAEDFSKDLPGSYYDSDTAFIAARAIVNAGSEDAVAFNRAFSAYDYVVGGFSPRAFSAVTSGSEGGSLEFTHQYNAAYNDGTPPASATELSYKLKYNITGSQSGPPIVLTLAAADTYDYQDGSGRTIPLNTRKILKIEHKVSETGVGDPETPSYMTFDLIKYVNTSLKAAG